MKYSNEKKKVGLVSLGCPKNQVDSEVMLGSLLQAGYELTAEAGEADIVIVNTCGFIDQAKEESIDTLIEMGELKKNGRCQALIATGCLTQRYSGDLLDQLPEIDAVVGTGDFPKIASLCDALLNPKRTDNRPNLTETPTYLYQPETPRLRPFRLLISWVVSTIALLVAASIVPDVVIVPPVSPVVPAVTDVTVPLPVASVDHAGTPPTILTARASIAGLAARYICSSR